MIEKPAGSIIPDDASYHNQDNKVPSYSLKFDNHL
jgi:hypothetical protein